MNELTTANTGHMMNTVNPDLLTRFISFLDASPKTISTYTRALRQFFKYLADHEISAPTRADVLAYREALKASRHKPATVQSYIIAVRQFFKWTASEGICPDIADKIKGAKISRLHKKDALTNRQVKALFAGIDRSTLAGARDYAVLAVMAPGGCVLLRLSGPISQTCGPWGMILFYISRARAKKKRAPISRLPLRPKRR
jgi:integrase/recombinase XerC